jgi:hypothetical protein
MELPTLTAPQQLWWLLAVLPLLFWLAQPPRPRRMHLTSHRAQWLLAQASLRRRPPRFRALRWLLLSMAAGAVAFAQAAPRSAGRSGPERLVVLLDGSASMAARRGGESAFARAVELVRRELESVPPHVEVEVVRLGAVCARWRGAAARELAEPGEPAGELPAPLPALAAAAADARTAVFVVTDGQDGTPAGTACATVGAAAANTALAVDNVDDRWPRPELGVAVTLHNFGPARKATVRASGALARATEATVELPANGVARVPLQLVRSAAGGEVLVRATATDDALPLDDQAALAVPPLPAPRIAVLGDDRGALFVQRAAQALADEVGGSVVEAKDGGEASFLLIEGGSAAVQPGSAAMAAFGVRAPDRPIEVWAAPTLVDWDHGDPLLAGLDFSELSVQHALRDALPDGKPLITAVDASGTTRPLAVLVQGPRAASLHFAFRLQDSTLPLLAAFPQLLRRALLRGHGDQRVRVLTPAPSLHEADLERLPPPSALPLPAFAEPGQDLAPWCLLVAALLLAARAGLR